MLKVTISADCDNSPKNALLRDLNVAFAKIDLGVINRLVSDDIEWEIVGDSTVKGREDFIDAVKQMEGAGTSEFILETAISHGKHGSASGTIVDTEGNAFRFNDTYVFTNAKGIQIQKITSYVIGL